MADRWDEQDEYWRSNYGSRPYASGRTYDDLRGGYRYGYDAAQRYQGQSWDEVETDLSRDWGTYEHRGQSTWENIKDAVRDAWARMTTGSASSNPPSASTTYGSGAGSTSRTSY